MYKKLLILLCALLMLLEPLSTQATSSASVADRAAVTETAAMPRPNYKAYRGNSRHRAKKLGVFRRWSLRRKALRKRKHRAAQPTIRVDRPTRNR
ncbi:hypothetical protein [Hymenobacter elongatus]|uniref:Uncharacterized protein n=1 Tax=Hymenobacter elongatus TaxID=877208 RepID=A0A4Z0PFG4_9BACT|nr:hypothetical protein [Hymenobacter elongatus]TGE12611.1 hypothetical protein E5J99_20065 [Hymenobacter elongatus]